MPGTPFSLEVRPRIPERLQRLEALADNLLYSWDRQTRGLFYRLDPELWESCGHNPKVFLRRVAQEKLDRAAHDLIFLQEFNRVLSYFDIYHNERVNSGVERLLDPKSDLVAYFCAEFGLHESFPIYSGGLGILAGDHCKAASDLGVPFVGVGLLYRQGYFNQTIDGEGNQIAHYTPKDFADLPVEPARNSAGEEIHVRVSLPTREVEIKVWSAQAGHICLYLLDTDLPGNSENDRSITYQLYGGDTTTRIQQEIVLGIGGVRALRAVGLKPTVWHINEGHAAFQILERCREQVAAGLDFDSALELIASGTVFTTHTPVPAGHDIFTHELMDHYLGDWPEQLKTTRERFLALGESPGHPHGFNQTALALRGTRFHNGVSRIHGGVAAEMEQYIWPQVPPTENPIRHVTNGVHVQTFLANEWMNLFDMHFGGGWRNELFNRDYWQCIETIPDHSYWSVRQSLKAALLDDARKRIIRQYRRNGASEALIRRKVQFLNPHQNDVLVLGFARRFATYKRATLLFSDPERLARLLGDSERPVLVLFAGKAHPNDQPGQQLIKVIHEFSARPEFEGKLLFLEGYDLGLARRLVSGVDVWLNNPEYPMEASGTSGQKAGINGVINLSILDGWWGEGYNGDNGWAITPHGPGCNPHERDREEARELLDLLEHHVIPLYYRRNGSGYPEDWVEMSKQSMISLLPRFSSQRMVMDYVTDFYRKARDHQTALATDGAAPAAELAAWKRRIHAAWPGVHLRRANRAPAQLTAGDSLLLEVAAQLNGLNPDDVVVECLFGRMGEAGEFQAMAACTLSHTGHQGEEALFALNHAPDLPGLQYYKLRIYPWHRHLAHRFETGCMKWI